MGIMMCSFKLIPFLVAFFLEMCTLLSHSSGYGRFRRSPNPSIPKAEGFRDFSRDPRFVGKLVVILAKANYGLRIRTWQTTS